MALRPRPKVMTLTDAAAARIGEIVGNAAKPAGRLRIGVKNGGCAGMSYTMDLTDKAAPHDEVVEDKGVAVLVDARAVLFLLGTEMDFEVTTLKSGFVFRNPNETGACGCGESVSITPVELET
ncbi:Iron-sulfur cluster assembly iron binding protein SufA [hydrothermal vent metagenome]|uniref:Iron-sulfur cluster assembly iron binding protein SufA n=1 Tax=hydrothermal vent metagenome TaxID=652676 RepID=A0A3B0TIE4_9ZZZZ